MAVHTLLPIEVAVCRRPHTRVLGEYFGTFLGDPDAVHVDRAAWAGYPCHASSLRAKLAHILARPHLAVRVILEGGGQDEPFVPWLFFVPLLFLASCAWRGVLRLPCYSFHTSRVLLKGGIALGCRGAILARSLADPSFRSVYCQRYAHIEFFIMAYTAWVVEVRGGGGAAWWGAMQGGGCHNQLDLGEGWWWGGVGVGAGPEGGARAGPVRAGWEGMLLRPTGAA